MLKVNKYTCAQYQDNPQLQAKNVNRIVMVN